MKILLLRGPNLNMLGMCESEVYGSMTGVVFNPGGHTHTSIAWRNAISAIQI